MSSICIDNTKYKYFWYECRVVCGQNVAIVHNIYKLIYHWVCTFVFWTSPLKTFYKICYVDYIRMLEKSSFNESCSKKSFRAGSSIPSVDRRWIEEEVRVLLFCCIGWRNCWTGLELLLTHEHPMLTVLFLRLTIFPPSV